MQWATRVNEAYQTCGTRSTAHTICCELQGRCGSTLPTPDGAEFLMQQMEWREAIEEARGGSAACWTA
jgi:molecular chaperone HscB